MLAMKMLILPLSPASFSENDLIELNVPRRLI